MKYDKAIEGIWFRYRSQSMWARCYTVSKTLARLIAGEFPDYDIYTAEGDNIPRDSPLRAFENHQVTVVDEGDRAIAIDATAPIHDKQDYFLIEAPNIGTLTQALTDFYKGDWRLNTSFDRKTERFESIEAK